MRATSVGSSAFDAGLALVGTEGAEDVRDALARLGCPVTVFPWSAALRVALEQGAQFSAVLALQADPGLDALESPSRPLLRLERGAASVESLRPLVSLLQHSRQLEVALHEQGRAAREVTATLVHDLRNPVQSVVQLAEALGRGELLSAQGRVDLEGLLAAARGASRRVERLRRPRLDAVLAAEGAVRRVETSLREVVDDALRHTGFPPGVARWRTDDADLVVRADPLAMRRALEHVLANARLHGGGEATVDVQVDGEWVALEVGDRGPRQASNAVVEGSGLRLAREVLAGHGGTLELEGGSSGGLLVRMRWPGLVRRRPFGLAPTPSPAPTAVLRVWLIDDDRAVLRTMGRLLRHAGHEVRTFDRGAEVLLTLEDGQPAPDVLLCDQDMPGICGLDLLRRIRTLAPGAARVLFTAYAPTAAVIDAFNQGAVHRFIQKDDGPGALQACVEALATERRAQGRRAAAPAREPVRADLEMLLAEVKIDLHVQPLFEAGGSRRLVACEALMRSRHPNFRGPLEILDAARVYDRELKLQKILCDLSRGLRDRLPDEIDLLVNIDPALLRSPRHLDDGLAPLYPVAKGVVLELTERARLGSDMAWEAAVQKLRDLGFRIALDDVGAGYNSLGAVAAVKPDVIKLDISLVSGVHRDPRRGELVRLLCDYAARHAIGTVAEGIEHAEEAEVCTELGVRWLQGFHLGRPMPLSDLGTRFGVSLRG